jgi:hypothetical protein
MALYSLGLIEKASNAIFHSYASTYTMQESFRYKPNSMGHAIALAKSYSSLNLSAEQSPTENRVARSQTDRVFDPSFDSNLDNKIQEKFTVEGSTMYLNLSGSLTVGDLQKLYSNTDSVQSALYLSLQQSTSSTTNLIKLNVAIRHEEDADLPEFWAMSKTPDLRFVFNQNDSPKNRGIADIKLDVTTMLCDSPRYRESGTQWRSHFTPSTYNFIGE